MLAAVYFKSLPGGEVYPLVSEKIQKFPLYVADTVFQLYLTSLSGRKYTSRALRPPDYHHPAVVFAGTGKKKRICNTLLSNISETVLLL